MLITYIKMLIYIDKGKIERQERYQAKKLKKLK